MVDRLMQNDEEDLQPHVKWQMLDLEGALD